MGVEIFDLLTQKIIFYKCNDHSVRSTLYIFEGHLFSKFPALKSDSSSPNSQTPP